MPNGRRSMEQLQPIDPPKWVSTYKPARVHKLAHPAAELFPMIGEMRGQDGLAADVAQNGVRYPVVMYQGKVLDGRNRLYVAADHQEARESLRFVEYTGDDP